MGGASTRACSSSTFPSAASFRHGTQITCSPDKFTAPLGGTLCTPFLVCLGGSVIFLRTKRFPTRSIIPFPLASECETGRQGHALFGRETSFARLSGHWE